MKVLVTGVAGFICGYLVEELLARGYEVVELDKLSKYGEVSQAIRDHSRYLFERGDAKDASRLTELLRDCDHLVAGILPRVCLRSPRGGHAATFDTVIRAHRGAAPEDHGPLVASAARPRAFDSREIALSRPGGRLPLARHQL